MSAVLARIQQQVHIPVGVGFGIRDGQTAHTVAQMADAVIIGSRIIQLLEDQPHEKVNPPGDGLSAWHPQSNGRIMPPLASAGKNLFWALAALAKNEGGAMSWLEKLLPTKAQATEPKERHQQIPEGLWVKCPCCEAVLYKTDLQKNRNVCPTCSHHHRINARDRLNHFMDGEGRYEIGQEVIPVDALIKDKDSRKYPERLKEAHETTRETDALVIMAGTVQSIPLVVACFEFDFMGGSMGSVVGERFVRGVEHAIAHKLAVHVLHRHGWRTHARRPAQSDADGQNQRGPHAPGQERLALHQRADRPHHGRCIGRVSFVGDVVIAEPKALIGFAGPRVIENTVRVKLPEGFQRAEFLQEKGGVDAMSRRSPRAARAHRQQPGHAAAPACRRHHLT